VIILLFALCCKASFNCFITRNRYKICLVGNNYEITYQRDVDERIILGMSNDMKFYLDIGSCHIDINRFIGL
jgi:hypothetical protein